MKKKDKLEKITASSFEDISMNTDADTTFPSRLGELEDAALRN